MRYHDLVAIQPRRPFSVVPESRAVYEPIFNRVQARHAQPDRLVRKVAEAYAAGEPFLQNQARVEYMTEEALARSFAADFGVIVTEGEPNQIPAMVFIEPDKVDVYDVALHGRDQNRVRKTQVYATTDTYLSAGWKEVTTPVIEYDGDNPMFPDKAAQLEVLSMDQAAYHLQRKLDKIAWDTVDGAIGSFAGKKIWTFKDTDVIGLPTTNSLSSTQNFWRALREEVFPYFDNQDKGGNIIDIYVRTDDLKHLFKIAPVGTSLGEYTTFQEQVYRGTFEQGMLIYGHRVRIHPVNSRIAASGTSYAKVGPAFKMWLPMAMGVRQPVVPSTPGYLAFRLRAWYAVLEPSIWRSNYCKFTWSTTATADP